MQIISLFLSIYLAAAIPVAHNFAEAGRFIDNSVHPIARAVNSAENGIAQFGNSVANSVSNIGESAVRGVSHVGETVINGVQDNGVTQGLLLGAGTVGTIALVNEVNSSPF